MKFGLKQEEVCKGLMHKHCEAIFVKAWCGWPLSQLQPCTMVRGRPYWSRGQAGSHETIAPAVLTMQPHPPVKLLGAFILSREAWLFLESKIMARLGNELSMCLQHWRRMSSVTQTFPVTCLRSEGRNGTQSRRDRHTAKTELPGPRSVFGSPWAWGKSHNASARQLLNACVSVACFTSLPSVCAFIPRNRPWYYLYCFLSNNCSKPCQ